MLRGWPVFVLVVALVAAQTPEEQWLGNNTVMGGPISDKALVPCDDECLCESPVKPQTPHTTLINLNTVHLTWGKVSETPFCDTATHVQMMFEDSTSWTTVYNGIDRQMSLNKLPLDISISFRVRERNCAGLSAFSDPLIIRTPSDSARPAAPSVISKTPNEICLRWQGFDSDVSLQHRKVVTEPGVASPSWNITYQGPLTSVCVPGLASSTYYQFRLTVHDDEMEEPTSDSSVAKTEMSAPLTPTLPFVKEAKDSELIVGWSRPVSGINQSPVKLYVVEVCVTPQEGLVVGGVNDTQGMLTFYRVAQVQKMEAKIGGLSAGKVYGVRVKAINAAGESGPSKILYAPTKSAVPDTPEGILFTAATYDTIRIDWSGADENGSPITSYEVMMSAGGALADFSTVYSGIKNHTRLTGLLPRVYYGFKVRAINAVGPGQWSEQFNIQTPNVGEVLTDEELVAASSPMKRSLALATALLQDTPHTTHHTPHMTPPEPQLHLQLMSALMPQADGSGGGGSGSGSGVVSRQEPDPVSDDLTGPDSVVHYDVPEDLPEPVIPVDVVNGKCQLKGGCMQKDAVLVNTPPCPGDCYGSSGQGYCLPSGKCKCATGWRGDDCNKAECEELGGDDCGGNGLCIKPNVCSCKPGHNSPNCQLYWAPVFHANDEITSPESLRHLRESRLTALNYSLTSTLPYPNPNNSLEHVQGALEVPQPARPAHPRRVGAVTQAPAPVNGGYIGLPYSPQWDFGPTQSFTVGLWFRSSDRGAEKGGMLVVHGPFSHGTGWGVGMLPGGSLFCGVGSHKSPFRASNLPRAVTSLSYGDGLFHHVACRVNMERSVINLLVDGNEVPLYQPFPYTGGKVTYDSELLFDSLSMVSAVADGYPLVIGSSFDLRQDHFDGIISDVRIWELGRTYDQIRRAMWNPLSVPVPGLSAYLPLSDCSEDEVRAMRWSRGGKGQVILMQNMLTDCQLFHHPLAKPSTEADDLVLSPPVV